MGGVYYLKTGIIESDLDSVIVVDITPELAENKKATFEINGIKLSNEDDLEVRGKIIWDFPLSTTNSSAKKVESKEKYFRYAKFKLTGFVNVVPQSYLLIEPYNFKLNINTSSLFVVREDEYYFEMDGNIELPIKFLSSEPNNDGNVKYAFNDQRQLFYMNQESHNSFSKIIKIPIIPNPAANKVSFELLILK